MCRQSITAAIIVLFYIVVELAQSLFFIHLQARFTCYLQCLQYSQNAGVLGNALSNIFYK